MKMHRFYYKFQAILSAIHTVSNYTIADRDQTLSLYILMRWFFFCGLIFMIMIGSEEIVISTSEGLHYTTLHTDANHLMEKGF